MLRFEYLWQNLFRKRLRTALTIAAVGIPMFVYVLGMSLVRTVEGFMDQAAKQMRLVVVQKSSIINPLPAGYKEKIEALDTSGTRLVSVCTLRWFGGRVPGTPTENYFLAADTEAFLKTYTYFNLTAEETAHWLKEKRAAVVGRAPAGANGWNVGDVITIEATVPPFNQVELVIVAIPQDSLDSETSFMRFDYLNEELKKTTVPADNASFFLIKCATRADMIEYRKRIDEAFAHTPYETKTMDEKAFLEAFISAKFDLPERLRLLSYVVVAVAIMAAANTMTMTFRDRIGEYGAMKAMGFSAEWVGSLLVWEGLLLAVVGGVIGAMLPYAAFNWTPLHEYRIPELGRLNVRFSLVMEAFIASVVVGLASASIPGIRAARLRTVEALKRV